LDDGSGEDVSIYLKVLTSLNHHEISQDTSDFPLFYIKQRWKQQIVFKSSKGFPFEKPSLI